MPQIAPPTDDSDSAALESGTQSAASNARMPQITTPIGHQDPRPTHRASAYAPSRLARSYARTLSRSARHCSSDHEARSPSPGIRTR